MELDLSPELQAKLDEVAAQRGRDAKSLAKEAVERLVDYDAVRSRSREGPGRN